MNDDSKMNVEDADSFDDVESYKQRLLNHASLESARNDFGQILNETVRDSSKV